MKKTITTLGLLLGLSSNAFAANVSALPKGVTGYYDSEAIAVSATLCKECTFPATTIRIQYTLNGCLDELGSVQLSHEAADSTLTISSLAIGYAMRESQTALCIAMPTEYVDYFVDGEWTLDQIKFNNIGNIHLSSPTGN